MKTVMINENQIGLLFKNGGFVKLLTAGKYRQRRGSEIELISSYAPIVSQKCPLEKLLTYEEILKNTVTLEVSDEELALHYVNGGFVDALPSGRYAFFRSPFTHTFTKVNTTDPTVDGSVPTHIFKKLPTSFYTKVEVAEYEKALIYFDKKLVKVLDAGTFYFWKGAVKVESDFVDMRKRQMDLMGQEILTADKVSLRINFVCRYRVLDCVKIVTEIEDFSEMMHVTAQLALREFVGKYRLDEILENKEGLSRYVFERLKEKEREMYIEITDAGVKDIILPGEIRDIMNTVLVAEKRAQANVITRREEVASTRSLLNTARLMDENETLYKLKELEFIERISANVGNINLNAGGDMLTQLVGLLRRQT
ncbi:MAG: slipin family protein [Clostridia bacterium]|nr:slipin family protein [Clostridia bacterium]